MEIKDLDNWENAELSDQELEAVSGGFGGHGGHGGQGRPPHPHPHLPNIYIFDELVSTDGIIDSALLIEYDNT